MVDNVHTCFDKEKMFRPQINLFNQQDLVRVTMKTSIMTRGEGSARLV